MEEERENKGGMTMCCVSTTCCGAARSIQNDALMDLFSLYFYIYLKKKMIGCAGALRARRLAPLAFLNLRFFFSSSNKYIICINNKVVVGLVVIDDV